MENLTQNICQNCFRPQVEAGAQPSTQWVSICRCDRPYLPSSSYSIDVCAQCKRRVAINASGAVTSPFLCGCEKPQPKKVATYLKQNESDAITLDLASVRVPSGIFPLEKYTPLAILGDKSTATVILARDKQRGTKVAVKIFKGLAQTMQSAFQSEVKKNQQLSHTNIAKIVDVGIQDGKTPYLVTEYKDGFSLEQYLSVYGIPSYDVTVRVLLSLCETLSYAQKQGILHGDVKPGNIIFLDDMNSEPSISITDFSLPKVKQSQQLIDPTDAIYMSAEEARGLNYSEKSELYSIGCVGYALLTGRPPFQDGTALDIKNMHALKLPPRISSIKFDAGRPSELEEIVEKCLEKDARSRFESIAKLIERLEVFPRREKLKISTVAAAKKKKQLLRMAGIALAIVVVLIIIAALVLRSH